MKKQLLILAATMALTSCADRVTAITNGAVTVRKEATGIRIDNGTNQARAYLANDPEWLALADLSLMAICETTDSGCLRIPANGTAHVPFSEIGGYSASTKTVLVWTWRVLPEGVGGAPQAVMDQEITLSY